MPTGGDETAGGSLPGRPELGFCYLHCSRLEAACGRPGLSWCRLLDMHERPIDLKLAEIRQRLDGVPL